MTMHKTSKIVNNGPEETPKALKADAETYEINDSGGGESKEGKKRAGRNDGALMSHDVSRLQMRKDTAGRMMSSVEWFCRAPSDWSDEAALFTLRHIAQGCRPSKVFSRELWMLSCLAYWIAIRIQAADWISAK